MLPHSSEALHRVSRKRKVGERRKGQRLHQRWMVEPTRAMEGHSRYYPRMLVLEPERSHMIDRRVLKMVWKRMIIMSSSLERTSLQRMDLRHSYFRSKRWYHAWMQQWLPGRTRPTISVPGFFSRSSLKLVDSHLEHWFDHGVDWSVAKGSMGKVHDHDDAEIVVGWMYRLQRSSLKGYHLHQVSQLEPAAAAVFVGHRTLDSVVQRPHSHHRHHPSHSLVWSEDVFGRHHTRHFRRRQQVRWYWSMFHCCACYYFDPWRVWWVVADDDGCVMRRWVWVVQPDVNSYWGLHSYPHLMAVQG